MKTLSPPLTLLGTCRLSLVFLVLLVAYASQTQGGRGTYSKKTAPLTWEKMGYYLPGSATKSGGAPQYHVNANVAGWSEWVERRLKPDMKLPAILYLHGCYGITAGDDWGRMLANFGFVVFQPDSFARPGRVELCGDGDMAGRQRLRIQEIKYAVSQMRELPWVDQDRLVLMGFSEGAQAVSAYPGREFVAHILIGSDCRFGRGRGARRGTPALNIVGSNDRWGYGMGCTSLRPDARGSKHVVIRGAAHNVVHEKEAHEAMAEFLEKCCGKAPDDR